MTQSTPIIYATPGTPLPEVSDVPEVPGKYAWAWAPGVFGLLTLLMFGDILFYMHRAAAHVNADLAMQFVPWREFGFNQLRQGNIPLWNPHIFGGAPYFAGFQAALLYPPNWLHLFLPIGMAINWISALHIFLAGYFTYLWCRGRYVSIFGSILAGVMFMFCGPYFYHLYAGHLPHIAVMVWTPLMLLTLDKLAETGNWRWVLLGVISTAMEILAGHPQYVYYTGMILGLYLLLRMIDAPHRLAMAIGFVAMYFGAVLISAMQLLPGLQATGEQVRSGGLPLDIASTFALPPHNLITLLVPSFYGSLPPLGETVANGAYWGTAYLWEVSLFISITGLTLAVIGTARNIRKPIVIIALVMILITLTLSLGRHVSAFGFSLYGLMYKYLPMYNSFRGAVKFAYVTSLFVALLAGMGFDTLLSRRVVSWFAVAPLLLVAVILCILGCFIWSSASNGVDGAWGQFVQRITVNADQAKELFFSLKEDGNESWTQPSQHTLTNLTKAGEAAATRTFLAASVVVLIAALLILCRLDRRAPYLLLVLAALELFCFARASRATMDPDIARTLPEPWFTALKQLPAGQRFLTTERVLERADIGMLMDRYNVSGYDPGVSKRYAELMYASQGYDPSAASQYLPIQQINPGVFRLLRCGLIINPGDPPGILPDPLPEALIISDYISQLKARNEILGYMISPRFDPARTVVLESDPGITTTPAAAPPGIVSILSKTTDTIELQAEMQRPGILLITDNYSSGWRVNPIRPGQPDYRIMPADYTLIGIPLQKGSHHIELEYLPTAFRIGRWITILSLIAFGVLTLIAFRPSRAKIAPPLSP